MLDEQPTTTCISFFHSSKIVVKALCSAAQRSPPKVQQDGAQLHGNAPQHAVDRGGAAQIDQFAAGHHKGRCRRETVDQLGAVLRFGAERRDANGAGHQRRQEAHQHECHAGQLKVEQRQRRERALQRRVAERHVGHKRQRRAVELQHGCVGDRRAPTVHSNDADQQQQCAAQRCQHKGAQRGGAPQNVVQKGGCQKHEQRAAQQSPAQQPLPRVVFVAQRVVERVDNGAAAVQQQFGGANAFESDTGQPGSKDGEAKQRVDDGR